MPIFTFACSCGWREDRRVQDRNTEAYECPTCGSEAVKEEVYAFAVSGFAETPVEQRTYWQEYKDFTEASAELEYKHSRMEESAGRTIEVSSPAVEGIKRGKALLKKGVKSSEDWMKR